MKILTIFSLLIFFGIFLFCRLNSFPVQGGNKIDHLRVDAGRIEKRINALAEFGKNSEGGVDRVAFSEADIQGRKYILSQMKVAGLKVRIDEAGNIVGRLEGKDSSLPPILSGSHSDSVPRGGRFDGAAGVICALECAQVLHENKIILRHPFEVVVFTDEEGGLVGSRAMTGTLTEEALEVVSHSGKTVRQGIRDLGGNPDKVSDAAVKMGEIKAFIEIHIEQGRILDSKGLNIGIVEGIVGINWWDVLIEGTANHAGTTPMNMREDALLAAARLIIAVNEIVTGETGGQVGTVGRIRAEPGAPNVIPGQVTMSLELRDLSSDRINAFFKKIQKEAGRIAKKSGTRISFSPIDATAVPAPTDPRIRKYIEESARDLGLSFLHMPSGAGHDAQDMAKITPTGMIFIPSVGGISHAPGEFTRFEDVTHGANVLLHTILKIDQE